MSRIPRMVVVVAALLTLAGCASAPPPPPAPDERPAASAGDAVQLVELWRVSDAEGAGDDAFLRLDGTELIAWTDCGIAMGAWRAAGSRFLADVSMSVDGAECLAEAPSADAPTASLAWLYAARGFRITDVGAELLATDGAVVARLAVDGAPPTNPDHTDDYLTAPELTPQVEAALVEPAPLGPGVQPVEPETLLGRWVPGERGVGVDADPPFLEFGADGTWRGSDGCNGSSGRWTQGADGLLLATSGVSTLMGCENWSGAYWLGSASRVGLVDGALAFYTADGTMLGAAARS